MWWVGSVLASHVQHDCHNHHGDAEPDDPQPAHRGREQDPEPQAKQAVHHDVRRETCLHLCVHGSAPRWSDSWPGGYYALPNEKSCRGYGAVTQGAAYSTSEMR